MASARFLPAVKPGPRGGVYPRIPSTASGHRETMTTTRTIEPTCGDSISDTASAMTALADNTGDTVTADFNQITLTATPGTAPSDIVAFYWAESQRRQAAYEASPEYAARMAAAKQAHKEHQEALAEALKTAPAAMTVKPAADGDTWEHHVSINTDPYSAGVIAFTALWGRLMEGQLAAGKTVADCAKAMSSLADTDGITGFMYGCAVGLLAKFWVHGEALRRWHNLDCAIGSEGEKANESGGVLNPALLKVG